MIITLALWSIYDSSCPLPSGRSSPSQTAIVGAPDPQIWVNITGFLVFCGRHIHLYPIDSFA
ncbi:hypothetical protein PM082_022962 [Marasmius tenuissimus]|nr:hypothetical protein PM082_022962 [Marasmius tenuissimus]